MKTLSIREDQVLYYRARRSHLAGPGARDAVRAARDIVGAQAQQPGPGTLALSQRTKGRPAAPRLKNALLGKKKSLVRTWGQRETLHIYDPVDWVLVAAARQQWAPGGRRGPMPDAAALDRALEVIEDAGTATRTDLLGVAPASYEKKLLAEHGNYIKNREQARRFAAGRLLWCLSMRGDVCVAHKIGAEQAYAARSVWFPKLAWDDIEPLDAAVALTRRYLSVNGPATARDLAHFFGARVKEARTWMEALEDGGEVLEVECGERKGLRILGSDADALANAPLRAKADWPTRLLPQWDTYLMGHADKTWTVPESADQKRVWRKSAVVAACVVSRGRAVAEWQFETRKDRLEVELLPLSTWTRTLLPDVKREAHTVAAHLGLAKAQVRLSGT